MIRVNKLLALGVGVLMSTSLFIGCSTNGLEVYNALGKSQNIKSMETQTDMSINVSAKNLSLQEQQVMNSVLPMINNSKISMLTKINQNEAKTVSKMQSDINMQMNGMPINMSIWVNSDLTLDKPLAKEVIKMPGLLTAQLPEKFKGKEYAVMDLENMTNAPGMPQQDYKKIIEFSKEFQPKILDFIGKYSKQFNPNMSIINKLNSEDIVQSGVKQHADIYEIKLNDKSFKDLIRYSLTNFSKNDDAINFVKEYILASVSMAGLPQEEIKKSQEEINKAFANFKTQTPELLAQSNATLDKLQNIKILGDKGITIKYAINSAGFIINEKANVEFVVDLPNLSKLDSNTATKDKDSQNPTGIYTISLISNSDMKKINENVTIDLPKVDGTNSFNYMDLVKSFAEALPVKKGWNSIDGKWYYGDSNGNKKTAWVNADNKWYYLGANGEMKTGWIMEGNKWYYLKGNGEMAQDTTINGYKVGSNGEWIN